jgi:hypothetical protein
MLLDTFTFTVDEGKVLYAKRWLPDGVVAVNGMVHVVHGMAAPGARDTGLAEALNMSI